jgi:hypothetical protein
MRKEVREIVDALHAQGFELVTTSKNHMVVYKDGVYVGTLPSTPRGDRWRTRTISCLRRVGFVWPIERASGRRK